LANILINQKNDRFVKKSGVLQIESGVDTYQLKFAQVTRNSINLNNFDRDQIDDQTPCFSLNGDKIGDATIEFKDTVDMYDSVTPATNVRTVSYWKEKMADGDPAVVTFIEKNQAPKSGGNQFARENWTGRIVDVSNETFVNQALRDATLEIEITSYNSGLRSAS
jgi:hypothetical protein